MATADRPNILCICTDQQRYDALGAYGNAHISTPTIDGLARDGVLFERCYVQSPVCAPARASLVTGRYVHAHGLWANGVALPPHLPLFPRALADAGYDCGLVGKLHLAAAFGGRTESRLDDGFGFFAWSYDPSHPSPVDCARSLLPRDRRRRHRCPGCRVMGWPKGKPRSDENRRKASEAARRRWERARRGEPAPKVCAVPGCDRAVYGLGLCEGHYWRVRRGGDPLADVPIGGLVRRQAPTWVVAGCGRRASGLDLCAGHRWRLKKYGDVRTDVPIRR